jgi:hypothetical protein
MYRAAASERRASLCAANAEGNLKHGTRQKGTNSIFARMVETFEVDETSILETAAKGFQA